MPALTGAAVAPGWDAHVHVFDAAAPVRPGHYLPAHRPLAQIETEAAALGIGHLVLVQPSVYGSDNRVMLDSLRRSAGRHRGVAVVEPSVSDADLDAMHAAGVRGVRFNCVSPAGQAGSPEAALVALAPRLAARGWHVQWYVHAAQLPQLVAWQQRSGLRFVLDHLAGLHAALPARDPAWAAVAALARGGAWIKLSGWYRLGAQPPYAALHDTVRRVADLFGPRQVWGSDWPHTSFAPDAVPAYAQMLAPLQAVFGPDSHRALLQGQPAALYLDTPA